MKDPHEVTDDTPIHPMPNHPFDHFRSDPSYWKLGIFYFCPADHRLIVPKRMRALGWTLNFARPLALPYLGFMLAAVYGGWELAGALGTGGDARFAIKLLAVLGLIALGYRLANPPPKTPPPTPSPPTAPTPPAPLEMPIDFDPLWELVTDQFHAPVYSVHGPDHWRRVERNGLLLATRTGADLEVVRLFALFHDSCRQNENHDHGHGARGAEYAKTLRGSAFDLPDDRFALLHYACVWHTDGEHHTDPTIATCWDADRLDLGRVGLIPDPALMSTDFGREIATHGSLQSFLP